MIKRRYLYLLLLVPCLVFGQQRDTVAERYSKTINTSLLRTHLEIVSSDEFEGRETGQKGQKKAADYIRKEFKNLGLTPGNDTSFLQNYPLFLRRAADIDFSADTMHFKNKKDFRISLGSAVENQVVQTKEMIFLGYGRKDSSLAFNDYKKSGDLSGKVVILYYGEPQLQQDSKQKNRLQEQRSLTKEFAEKIKTVQQTGACCALIITDDLSAAIKAFRENKVASTEKTVPGGVTKKELLVFFITPEMGDKIMDTNLEALMIARQKTGKSNVLKKKTSVKIDIHRDETGVSGDNVIGIVEGSSFKKNEYVFITAHYDHLGIINGQLYNGADDDGSGTVSVLALARAFAKAKEEGHGPQRSVVFLTFSGEEKGLLGSKWFVEHPTIPLSAIECDLNIDMIGRVDEVHSGDKNYLYIIGSDKLSSELQIINEQTNSTYTKFKLDYTYNDANDPNRFYYRSDHYNFAKNNIPVVFYFNGTHPDYHQPTDKIEKIDFGLMEKRAQLVFLTAWELANRPTRIVVDSNKK